MTLAGSGLHNLLKNLSQNTQAVLCLVSAHGPAVSRANAAPDFLERVETALDFDSIAAESLAPLYIRPPDALLKRRS